MFIHKLRPWRSSAIALAVSLALPAGAQVIVNDDGIFEVNANTTIILDGKPISRAFLDADGHGYRAKYVLRGEGSADFSRGMLDSIELDTRLRGPITAVDPLAVLAQPVIVTQDTIVVDVPGDDPSNLIVGDILDVSGLGFEDGTTEATLLKLRIEQDDDEWKVSGFATDLSETGFFIGELEVLVDAETEYDDCDEGLVEGQYVEVEAMPTDSYLPGDPVVAYEVECDEEDDLDAPPGSIVPAEIEGVISDVLSPDVFTIGEQVIAITPETEFENGSAENIQPGIRAEVEGLLDADSDILTAREVEFQDDYEIEISAPVNPEDITPGAGITVLGLTFTFANDIEDEDGIAASGISERRQIDLEGVILPDGSLVATEIEDDGTPRDSDIEIEGIVESIAAPTFTILGITIDVSAAELELDKSSDDDACDEYGDGSNGSDDCDDDSGDDGCDEYGDGSDGSDDCDDDSGDDGCDEYGDGSDGSDDCDDSGDDGCDEYGDGSDGSDDCDDDSGDDGCDEYGDGSDGSDDCDDDGENDGTSLEAFFAELKVGDRVEVEEASYDAATNTLFAREVEIDNEDEGEENDDSESDSQVQLKGASGSVAIGLGTITGSDRVFANAFE